MPRWQKKKPKTEAELEAEAEARLRYLPTPRQIKLQCIFLRGIRENPHYKHTPHHELHWLTTGEEQPFMPRHIQVAQSRHHCPAELHDRVYHGGGLFRSDNDWWYFQIGG